MKVLSLTTDSTGSIAGYQPASLLTAAAIIRAAARDSLDSDRQTELGQYFTPIWVAGLLASMVDVHGEHVRILDPGAGAGTLFTAALTELLSRERPPARVNISAFEIDAALQPLLERSATVVQHACESEGVAVDVDVRMEDFADWASANALGDLFAQSEPFDAAILNPPYAKLAADSDLRRRLDALGVAAPNLYAAFLGLALLNVRPGGSVVAIVPRSFCNGTYFGRFRRFLLGHAALKRVHLFNARNEAFAEDSVLQENIILSLERDGEQGPITLSFSEGGRHDPGWERLVSVEEVLQTGDPDRFIHLPFDAWDGRLSNTMRTLPAALTDLDLSVSTGPVVDFRARDFLADSPRVPEDAAPLLYPLNLSGAEVDWPVDGKKPQALLCKEATMGLTTPLGWYVITKRFTAKEERRRVVAAVVDPGRFATDRIALENHLNYFHRWGSGLERNEALGLATYLNTTIVDRYFRQFSGHTQVNASDLKKLRYPAPEVLRAVGRACGSEARLGREADQLVRAHCEELARMPEGNRTQQRIDEALRALTEIGVPREQQNERSALTLLALLGLTPDDAWSGADAPLMGVTPIMEWVQEYYERTYAPNTRETFRRFTLHQFVDAGFVIPNPDQPERPVNSPNYCYQIEPAALELLRTLGTADWTEALERYLGERDALREEYAQRREMLKIPLHIDDDTEITLMKLRPSPAAVAYAAAAQAAMRGDRAPTVAVCRILLYEHMREWEEGVTPDED